MLSKQNQPKKHCDLIKQWADGAGIQYWNIYYKKWMDTASPLWEDTVDYRVKVLDESSCIVKAFNINSKLEIKELFSSPNLELTFEASTGDLVLAEVIQ